MIVPDVLQEVMAVYRLSARRHRRLAIEHKDARRPLHAVKERNAVDILERAIRAELHNPDV